MHTLPADSSTAHNTNSTGNIHKAFVLQGRAMGRKEHKLIIQAVTAGHGKNATLNKNAHW
jgi:hypothetical protein